MKKDYDFTKLQRAEPKYMKHLKESITLRLDPHVVRYFKSLATKTGLPYQSLINYVLKDYARWELEPSSAWEQFVKDKRDKSAA